MNTNMFFRSAFALCCFLFSGTFVLAQESLFKIPIQNQIQESDLVIEGKVISKESFWDNKNIYTAHTVEVYKVFKGQPLPEVQIITKGGVVGLEAEIVSHSLQMNKGDLGVFILSESPIGKTSKVNSSKNYKSVSASQGFYRYNIESNKALNAFEVYDGITTDFYTRISEGSSTSAIELKSFDLSQMVLEQKTINQRVMAPIISSLTATENSAGTRSVLTITGSNFGATQGSIGFSDANFGGAIFTNALDSQILSWTDTQIEVEIPGHAGTGPVRINTNTNDIVTSSNQLIIDFAQTNLEYDLGSGSIAYQTQHIDNNTDGGNTWEMNLDFYNSGAKSAFESAFETWTCQSGVNWVVDSNTTTNTTIADDGQNLITFNNLSSGLLGQCTSRYSGCFVNGEIKWYVKEMDIVFNSNINWNYTTNAPASGEIDFETVAVHELGHGQQLGHVIDNDLIMHYSLSGGIAQRQLSPEDIMGAQDIMSRSTSTTICNQTSMTASTCFNSSLSANDFDLSSQISLYPNPARDNVFIKASSGIKIEKVDIYNMEGRKVYNSKTQGSTLFNARLNDIASGIYFIHIYSTAGVVNQKLIVR